ncbi:uncharacterized protein LOC127882369 [Dreissena polymorpha]|uniref:Globin domain-containing protein n=1 Tax=Dreissena polymorpha TaxID=45954 RepID=A0A9D4H4X8_DREPO|nr:uncharacterized protein LOC127882369 [Dreissena polymorpha]KAH3828357.1 hypothetical protein DPMN_130315 [Dreissena polymorpha]
MGNISAKTRARILNGQNNNTKTLSPSGHEPVLTEKEGQMLKDVWRGLQKDIQRIGVITFVSLFETHPYVHDAFMSFRAVNTSELEYNAILRKHALRVMGIVDKCITRLDNREKLRELMTELGIRHKSYSVKIEFIDLMGPQFISSIRPHLQHIWTDEHEQAWENLFRLMCYHMKKGMCSK